tara:strand:+ start:516 stop:974 length:459 start_codon:yes stop_codon:yes gene_type:complete
MKQLTNDELKQRFRSLDVGDNECWEWPWGRNRLGYGGVQFNKKWHRAHRVAWILFVGPIPKDMFVCHHCDNPPCVNPNHLWIGSHRDNVDDMLNKGRSNNHHGQNNPNARLTEDDVSEIKHRYDEGEYQYEIARVFGISQQHVSQITRDVRW